MVDDFRAARVADWFGPAFTRLHPALQALHRDGGTLAGPVDVRIGDGYAGFVGRRLARRLGIPLPAPGNTMQVTIFEAAEGLHWQRRFNGGRRFDSLFVPIGRHPGGHWIERSGLIELKLGVDIVDGGWHWRVLSQRLFGIALPRLLLPRTTAYKKVVDGRYRFAVDIALPIIGRVLGYRGDLTM
jgi:hypothetical protein